MSDAPNFPFSSGYVRGGAHVKANWGREFLDKVMRRELSLPATGVEPSIPNPMPKIEDTLLDTEKVETISRGQALSMGYTGDQCDNCNSSRMKISGHCKVCEDCGTTTGCS